MSSLMVGFHRQREHSVRSCNIIFSYSPWKVRISCYRLLEWLHSSSFIGRPTTLRSKGISSSRISMFFGLAGFGGEGGLFLFCLVCISVDPQYLCLLRNFAGS